MVLHRHISLRFSAGLWRAKERWRAERGRWRAERICICTDEVGQGGCTGLNTIYSVSAVVDLNKPETNSLNN